MSAVSPNDEEQAIRDLATKFFSERAPLASQQTRAKRSEKHGAPADPLRKLHTEMAQLGFFAQALPEHLGGLGQSHLASGLIAEAAGRELVPGPWLDQLIAVRILAPAGSYVVTPFVTGDRFAAVGFGTDDADRLKWNAGSGRLSGLARGLRFGDTADRWVFCVEDAVLIVDPAGGGAGEPVVEPGLDPLWRSVSARLDGVVPEEVLACEPHDVEAHLGLAQGLVAAFSVGASARVLEEAISYVKARKQFGNAVGSFQAIKHRAANAYIALLHARALAYNALEEGNTGALSAVRIAADGCYRQAAETALQMYGGIGFTSEVPIHLFLKNAQQLRGWPRPVGEERDRVRAQLRLDEPMEEVSR